MSTSTDTLCPSTALFRSRWCGDGMAGADGGVTGLRLDLDGLRGREPAAAEILRQRQGVSEQAAHPIILSDAEGRITGCNSAAESLFGGGWADAGGSDLATAVLAPADRAAYRAKLGRASCRERVYQYV